MGPGRALRGLRSHLHRLLHDPMQPSIGRMGPGKIGNTLQNEDNPRTGLGRHQCRSGPVRGALANSRHLETPNAGQEEGRCYGRLQPWLPVRISHCACQWNGFVNPPPVSLAS